MKKNRFLINTMEKVVNAVKSFKKNLIDSIGNKLYKIHGLIDPDYDGYNGSGLAISYI